MIELDAIFLLGPKREILHQEKYCIKCTLRVHSEFTLGCTSCGAINEDLLLNKSFPRNQIRIYGHAAKYLCKCYAK